jgi:sporadic carbohydrate cluster protein (TIGR04323 family)
MTDTAPRNGFKGYCIHQPFGGMQIPIPGQNAVMRDYAARQDLVFKLSVNELNFPNCHMMLDSLTNQLDGLEGIIMTSLFILPKDVDARDAIFRAVFDQSCAVHVVFENLVIRDQASRARAEEIISVANTVAECPQNIADEIIPPLPVFQSFTN